MKLKILKKFPKKITGNIDERTYAISTAGGNAMIDQIGEIEVELDRDKIIDNLKSQLQKQDNIIKGMNQIIQKKTLTKKQVFGK
ncbi:hypothetical protein LCGC14_2325230 [marine sediment metagenome]|uniref:Uncharacterized protein n=1 Tax=marine sediment metagenome TaxID=412755 RepID=A0A0F9D455_9ZZZZ